MVFLLFQLNVLVMSVNFFMVSVCRLKSRRLNQRNMDLITAVMGDQATEVEVTAILTVVVVELVVPAVAAVGVAAVMGMVVLIDLLQRVMDMIVAQE